MAHSANRLDAAQSRNSTARIATTVLRFVRMVLSMVGRGSRAHPNARLDANARNRLLARSRNLDGRAGPRFAGHKTALGNQGVEIFDLRLDRVGQCLGDSRSWQRTFRPRAECQDLEYFSAKASASAARFPVFSCRIRFSISFLATAP